MSSKTDRVRMQFVAPWFRPVIRKLAKMAGVSTGRALRQAIQQKNLDGSKALTVSGDNGYSATYAPGGRE